MKMLAVVTYASSYPMMQHHYINPQVLGLTPLVYHATYFFFPFSIQFQSNSWAITKLMVLHIAGLKVGQKHKDII